MHVHYLTGDVTGVMRACGNDVIAAHAVNSEYVGNLGPNLELPWGLVSIGVALVPVSRIWRGPVATALGRLQYRYQ